MTCILKQFKKSGAVQFSTQKQVKSKEYASRPQENEKNDKLKKMKNVARKKKESGQPV